MKIHKLTIRNIASIEKAEIDFDREPLADDPIFLISGPTGSGKTTILNAICLVLYDKVPALEDMDGNSVGPEGLKAKNPQQLLRQGEGHALVELWFTGNDSRRYKSTWSVRRARGKAKGALQDTVRSLEDLTSGTRLDRKREVAAEIERLVGLTFDQFTRTTMLAQGQFASFVKASDAEKSEILEKLTRTGVYARIGRRIFELARDAERSYDMLDAEIKGARLLSEDERREYNANITNLDARLKEISDEYERVDGLLSWLNREEELRGFLAERRHAENELKTQSEAEATQQKRKTVERWDATADLRRLIELRRKCLKRIERIESRLEALEGDEWHGVADGLRWLETECARAEASAEEQGAELAGKATAERVWADADRIADMARAAKSAAGENDRHHNAAERLTAEAKRSADAEMPLAEAVKSAEGAVKKAESEVQGAEKVAAAFDTEALTSELKALTNSISEAEKAIAAVGEYHRAAADFESAKRAADDTSKRLAEAEKSRESLEAKLPDVKRTCELAESYLAGQMELKDHITSIRERFAESGECPLCGNKEAHLADDNAIDAKIDTSRKAARIAREQLEAQTRQLAEAKAEVEALHRELDRARKQEARAQLTLDQALSAAQKAAPDYADDECLEKISLKKKELETRRDEVSVRLTEGNAARNAVNAALKALDEARGSQSEADKRLEAQRRTTASRQAEAAAEQALAAEASAQVADYLERMGELLDSQYVMGLIERKLGSTTLTAANAVAVANVVKKCAEDYDRRVRCLEDTRTEGRELRRRHSEATASAAVLRGRFPAPYEPVAVECRDLEGRIRTLDNTVNRLDGELAGERKTFADNEADISVLLATGDATEEEAARIAATVEPNAVEQYRESLETLSQALAKATHEAEALAAQLRSHDEKRPKLADDDTIETLTVSRRAIADNRDNTTSERSRYITLLTTDDDARARLEAKCLELDKLRKTKNRWAILDKYFGASDGSRFRKIMQVHVLSLLMQNANYYLSRLSRRYRLASLDGSLGINVVDEYQGGVVRSVSSLSGGETFIVSLALALGLSAISRESINVDTLFIDEGFGSLDRSTLDVVVSTLEQLHRDGGRRIGIISHINTLQENIATQIRLVKNGAGASRVEVTTL